MASESDRDSINEDGNDLERIREHYKSKFGKLEDSSQSDSVSDSDHSQVPLAPVGDTNLTDSDFVEVSDKDSPHESGGNTDTSVDYPTDDFASDVEDELPIDSKTEVNDGFVAEPENEITFDFVPDEGHYSSKRASKPKRKEKNLKDPNYAAELKLLLLDDNSLKAVRAGLDKGPAGDGLERKLTRKERSRLSKLEKKMKQQGSDDDQVEEDGFQVSPFLF